MFNKNTDWLEKERQFEVYHQVIPDIDLVNISAYWIKWENYYFKNAENIWLSKKDLEELNITSDVYVSRKIINSLVEINNELIKKWFELLIKEGYRSSKTYKKAYELRVKKWGKENTDKLLNMKDMPHSTGASIDVALYNINIWKTEMLHKKEDWIQAFNKNYYFWIDIRICELRGLLEKVMYKYWFENLEKEYFHFNLTF